MFQLKNRKDGFRLLLPKDFLHPILEEKYTKILSKYNGFFISPIEFLNETIQHVDILGFNNAVITQDQQLKPTSFLIDENKFNDFTYPSYENSYRNPQSYLSLTDLTLNINFKHTLGYLNYFMIYENFLYQFSRESDYKDILTSFKIELFNNIGEIIGTVIIENPLINSIDMLSFDYSKPIAQSETFKVEFKYSNIKFEFNENLNNNLT